VSEFTHEDRTLFETEASALYEEAVRDDGLQLDDPRFTKKGALRPALDLLVSIGLLFADAKEKRYIPIDPASAQSRVVTPMSQHGAELISESGEWARTFGALSQAWRRSPASSRGPFVELKFSAVNAYLTGIFADMDQELLTAQPQAPRSGPGTAAILAAAAERDIAVLERGVKLRTLYQHSARRSAITHKYVSAVTRRGAEVRTLDEFFNRMIVVDRRIAVIPAQSGNPGEPPNAIAVTEPSVVAYLVDVFERHWERARPYSSRENKVMREVHAEQRTMTIRMLIEGHADPGSAKRLGVSPRTYAGYIADLKEEYDAETRFQLGYIMGRLGVSGEEDDPAGDNA
jgi:hypothetical protein